MTENYFLSTSNLNIGYGKKEVICGINLNVSKGSIVTLIGPNGCGKSTLLKTVSGQIKPLSGSITINNKDLGHINAGELARLAAVVFTGDYIRERLTVRDVVSLGRYPYTGILGKLSDEDQKIITEAMNDTNVIEYCDKCFLEISDGQKQRALLARAICQQPELLILDEPTTFLDVKYKLEFLSLLKKESRLKNITIIMSLHELDLARQISDQIVCIKDNRIDRIASSSQVFDKGYINGLFDIKVGNYQEENFRAVIE